MSDQSTPSKRAHEESSEAESNGRGGKFQKTTTFSSQNGGITLRVLCPNTRIGSVIGKSGSIISQIRQESGARIRVEESIPGYDERIIFISTPDKDKENDNADNGNGTEDQQQQQQRQVNKQEDDNEESKNAEGNEDNNDDDKQQPTAVEDSEKETEKEKEKEKEEGIEEETTPAIQKALLLIFERMVEGEVEKEKEGGVKEEGGDKASSFVVRLLVFSSQIGCLLGRAGSVIKQMSSDSGAQIRILPKDKLLAPASPNDELLQISGGADAVRKALTSVSHQLLEHGPRDQRSAYPSGPSSQSVGRSPPRQDSYAQPHHPFPGGGMPYSAGFRDGEAARMQPSQNLLTFRLWCPHDKIGGVIGKGGTIVRAIQNETGSDIKVLDGGLDSEDRIIVISGPAHPDDRISPVQDAVLRVQSRICRASSESQDKNVLAKLLVSSNQIGCLLGKGGSIITEMRKSTGAYIRILGKDQLPKGASGNEEVVQMNGDLDVVQDALVQITNRLREHFFRDAFPSMNYPPNPAFVDQVPPFPPYMGRRELSPSAMYSNLGRPPHSSFHPHDEHPPFMPNFHRQGIPPHMSDRMPSSAAWGPQGQIDAAGPLGLPDYTGAPQRRMSGFGGANPPTIITSTTIEVVVPRTVVPAIYGEDGGCLRQIREISDAKVAIKDSKPGATETLIIISGTPEQTNAAQSLIQAFVISETVSN